MIELTPLDVRKKRGDFRRVMRGFDPAEVDSFLELVAERMESLVKEVMTLKERAARLGDQVKEQGDREKAVQDALVTAQELRKDISGQAQREAELMRREAENEIERMLLDAELRTEELRSAAVELERRRRRFLRDYRHYLERELEDVVREGARHPLDDKPLELALASEDPAPPSEGAADLTEGHVEEAEPTVTAADSAAPEGDDDPGEAADSGEVSDDHASDDTSAVAVESLAPEHGDDESGDHGSSDGPHRAARIPVRSDAGTDPSEVAG